MQLTLSTMQAFENLRRWAEECLNPSLRTERQEVREIIAEESKLNSYQKRILSDIREFAEHGPSEVWVESLEKVNAFKGIGGTPGIVLRRSVDGELHMIGVYQGSIRDSHGLEEPAAMFFVRSYKLGERVPQLEIHDSTIARVMFRAIRERSPFSGETFDLKFPRVKEVTPGGNVRWDFDSVFASTSFQLDLQQYRKATREAPVMHDRRKEDKAIAVEDHEHRRNRRPQVYK